VNVDQAIELLQALKTQHGGEIDVTVWQYAGGNDELCDVEPRYDAETQTVVIEAKGRNCAMISR
jgi:hypothetical protein